MMELRAFIRKRDYLNRLYLLIIVGFLLVCVERFSWGWEGGCVSFIVLSGDGKRLLVPVRDGEIIVFKFIHSYNLAWVEDYLLLFKGCLYVVKSGAFGEDVRIKEREKGKTDLGLDLGLLSCGSLDRLPDPLYIRVSSKYETTLLVHGVVYRLFEIFGDGSVVKLSVSRRGD